MNGVPLTFVPFLDFYAPDETGRPKAPVGRPWIYPQPVLLRATYLDWATFGGI